MLPFCTLYVLIYREYKKYSLEKKREKTKMKQNRYDMVKQALATLVTEEGEAFYSNQDIKEEVYELFFETISTGEISDICQEIAEEEESSSAVGGAFDQNDYDYELPYEPEPYFPEIGMYAFELYS